MILLNNCTVNGAYQGAAGWSGSTNLTVGTAYWIPDGLSNYVSDYREVLLTFSTPKFVGVSKYIEFRLPIDVSNYSSPFKARFALCSSDKSKANYRNQIGEVTDEYQIASGLTSIIEKFDLTTYTKEIVFTIETNKLRPNTKYYIFFWGNDTSSLINAQFKFNGASYSDYKITLASYGGAIRIDNGSEFEYYHCYVDNGTSWDLYVPHIDNGSGWDLCS